MSSGQKSIINSGLKPLEILIGKWKTTGTHPLVPGKELFGLATFDWIEEGGFIRLKTTMDKPIPDSTSIIGSDETMRRLFLLYYDERGVSRMYEMSFNDNEWRWWRNEQDFAQRFTGNITDDGNKIIGVSELCTDGSTWNKDLELTYTRVK